MCGIAGFVGPLAATDAAPAVLERMADAIRHRGPDDSGIWVDAELAIGLAHRRLSIVDLSPAGHQPMISASTRYVIVFNGEIYNHAALSEELRRADTSLTFRGHSDTEVMLAAFERWGVDAALRKFNGMFAFALVDRRERRLHLARDRLGEKPLYYARLGDSLLFGSELKALKCHPSWRDELDRTALLQYFRYAYVPGSASIYRGVNKVPPGCCVTLDLSRSPHADLRPAEFWSANEVMKHGLSRPLVLSDEDAIGRLKDLLTDAIKLRMVSDVPLGAFLSGGIDSSTVVAIMQQLSGRRVKTFSIGFGEARFNEAESAREVASYIGTDHVELYVTPGDSLDVIPLLPAMYDEPFADPSQIPTYLVSRLARTEVTVSLSGDGGDELFCGYERYEVAANLARGLRIPKTLRRMAARSIRAVPLKVWDALGKPLPQRLTAGRAGDRLYKVAQRLGLDDFADVHDSMLRVWQEPQDLLAEPIAAAVDDLRVTGYGGSRYEQMMAFDLRTYLPDDILVKVDRASMAVSLEARVPLLDHRVVELAWQLPMTFKRRDGVSKWLLRQVLYSLVPRSIVDRPKQGFGVPIEHWLRNELREWACDLLAPASIAKDGILNAGVVSRHLNEHLSGQRSWATQLWTVLMFQAWLRHARSAG